MNRIAAAISAGLVPRRSGISSHCRANWSGVCRGLGTVGPGPMPFTRMRGASASAMVWVKVHNPAFAKV